jgi:hypothetical protein
MKDKLIEIFGWYGIVAIIGSYALISFGQLSADSYIYQLLNGTGALGIAIVSYRKKVLQSAVLNAIWTLIAVIAIIRILS